MTGGTENSAAPPPARPGAGQLLARALRLRCPRCGSGRLFRKWFSMHERCTNCGLKFEPAPGYYLGAIYISYGLTAVLLIVSYLVLHNGFELSNEQLSVPMLLICVLVPLAIFRHSRALWLALDCLCDVSVMNDETESHP